MLIYIRPSGSEIELKDTPEMKEFAKKNNWKLKDERKIEDNNSRRVEGDRSKPGKRKPSSK